MDLYRHKLMSMFVKSLSLGSRCCCLISLIAFMTCVAISAEVHGGKTQGMPKLVCDEPIYDFGDTKPGEKIRHVFTLRNDGTSNLEIIEIKPDCGCVVAKLDDRKISPASEVSLLVEISLKKTPGRIRKDVMIRTNDPNKPKFKLVLKGDVVSPVTVVPSHRHLGRIETDGVTKSTVDIFVNDAKGMDISGVDVETDARWISARVESLESRSLYRVHLSTLPPLETGNLSAELRVLTDRPDYPVIKIPVSARVVGQLAYSPNEILLVDNGGQPVTRYVVISAGTVDDFRVTDVRLPLETMQTNIRQAGKIGFRVQLSNLVAEDELDGQEFVIYTDVPEMSEIHLPIRIVRDGQPLEMTGNDTPIAIAIDANREEDP